jgi:cytochrome c-type biogenesis protein
MPSLLALVSTFSAGLVSFVAPCTLPLVPAYLAYAGGLAGMDLTDAATRERARGRLLVGTLLFVLGFGVVFVLLGIAAGGIGHAVHSWGTAVQVVGGLLLVVFGLILAGVLRLPGADRNYRFEMPQRIRRLGLAAAFPFGVIFGIGWTPCVGPFLGTALSLAAVSSQAVQGAILLAAYALGLGVPFLVVALAWASYPGLARGLGRFGAASSRVAGLIIAALGIAVATGLYSHVTSFLAQYSL